MPRCRAPVHRVRVLLALRAQCACGIFAVCVRACGRAGAWAGAVRWRQGLEHVAYCVFVVALPAGQC